VADGAVDLGYSFAEIQHVTDEVFKGLLGELRRILKPEGVVVCHVVLDIQKGWTQEAAGRADRTLKGHLKWRCALQCFSRSRNSVERLVADAGFRSLQITNCGPGS
jgi:cyclopropane fatty-acyl-phospholipid synthase-like methyltransferase